MREKDENELMLELIDNKWNELSAWESDFITSINENGLHTEKQKTKLDEIFERVF